MKKKLLVLTIAAVVALTLLAGCNNHNESIEYTQAANGAQVITRESAMNSSVNSQKINGDDVTFTKVELDTDDGKSEYEVEFIYDGYKYKIDIDAETGDVIEVEKELFKQNDDIAGIDTIPEEVALEAVLEKAGLSGVGKDELEQCRIVLEKDDGIFDEYDIEFIYQGIGYEASVSAANGKVYDFEKWYINVGNDNDIELDDNDDDDDGDDDDDDDGDDDVVVIPENVIDKDSALNIALGHAGVALEDATDIHIDFDDDDAEYEIEFMVGYTEYDYDVDAITGEILNFDREGEHVSAPEFSKPDDSELIGRDAAKAAALEHAGVSANDVVDFEIDLDDDNGEMVYEIEFKCGDTEYEYDINALDGSVIRHSSEIDD